MLISNSRNFVFIHIPKNGGESITRALSTHSSVLDIELGSTRTGAAIVPEMRRRYGLWKHSSIEDLRDHLGDERLSKFKLWATCRDPLARAWSLFRYFRKTPLHPPHAEFPLESFDAFVDSKAFREGRYISGPQSTYVDPINLISRIVRLEALSEEWPGLCAWLGVSLVKLSRVNSTSAGPRPETTKFALQTVQDVYKSDYDLWSY